MFKTCVFIIVFFNQVRHMIITYLCKYNNLQLFINFIDQCELPKKCVAIISFNDFNHDGNVFRNFIALLCKNHYVCFKCVLTCCASFIGVF